MGAKCCSDNRLYNIYDTINYIEREEVWLKESIEHSNKNLRSDVDIV